MTIHEHDSLSAAESEPQAAAHALVDRLNGGERVSFDGEHYRFGPMTFLPRPVQRPRIPIWVVGAWPSERSMARAARWDGLVAQPIHTYVDGIRLTLDDLWYSITH